MDSHLLTPTNGLFIKGHTSMDSHLLTHINGLASMNLHQWSRINGLASMDSQQWIRIKGSRSEHFTVSRQKILTIHNSFKQTNEGWDNGKSKELYCLVILKLGLNVKSRQFDFQFTLKCPENKCCSQFEFQIKKSLFEGGSKEGLFSRQNYIKKMLIVRKLMVQKECSSIYKGFLARNPHKLNYTPIEPLVTSKWTFCNIILSWKKNFIASFFDK